MEMHVHVRGGRFKGDVSIYMNFAYISTYTSLSKYVYYCMYVT
jgi:hypothetical protein